MSGIQSLLDVSRRALFAQTQAIRVTGTNVANVNTPGYSRRKAELVALAPSGLGDQAAAGTGVEVNRIIRRVDSFLNREFLLRINDRGQSEVRSDFLSRAEEPFSLDSTAGHIGYELSQFFSALDDLTVNPSNLALRSRVIDTGRSLVQSVNTSMNIVADLQREANGRIGVELSEVNRLSGEIADLNSQIAASESGNQENLTLRDKRDELMRTLSEKVKIAVVEKDDGTVLVSLENGFALVSGVEAKELTFSTAPSFAPVGGYPLGMDGSPMGFIVYDFDPSATDSHVNLTNVIASGGGTIGGLLTLRGTQANTDTDPFDANGDLVEIGTRIEALARDLLTRFNQTYRGPDENAGLAGTQGSSGDLNGLTVSVYGMFSFTGAVDTDADGLADDLVAINNPSYARALTFNISDASSVAAARDLNVADGATTFATGDGSNIAAMAALRDTTVNYGVYGVGSFSQTSTIEDLYHTSVTFAGGLKNSEENSLDVFRDREEQVRELQASVSGVSLDEEFANLINFQRAFEGSARMIKVGDQLLEQILNLI